MLSALPSTMPGTRISIRRTAQVDRVRGVPLSHPGCAALITAGVRSLGLDWRMPGSTWGEGVSPSLLLFWMVSGKVALAAGPAASTDQLTAGPDQCLVVPPTTAKRLTSGAGPVHAAYIHLSPRAPWTEITAGVLPAARARHVAALITALADETVGIANDHLARQLSEAIITCCLGLTAADLPRERARLQTLWDEVASAPERPWQAAGLARRVGMSVGNFHRRVLALHGRPPMALVRQMRLERAADRLRTSHATLAEIADEVGYASGFALSNALRQHLGVRPRQLRRSDHSAAPRP
ncbi:hypothetical protein LBMAG53_37650 [Planctomycetota bacterium]|nr:hypothetical protein LBMAG53_37650 [Planctomycetota bacterium]